MFTAREAFRPDRPPAGRLYFGKISTFLLMRLPAAIDIHNFLRNHEYLRLALESPQERISRESLPARLGMASSHS